MSNIKSSYERYLRAEQRRLAEEGMALVHVYDVFKNLRCKACSKKGIEGHCYHIKKVFDTVVRHSHMITELWTAYEQIILLNTPRVRAKRRSKAPPRKDKNKTFRRVIDI